MRAPASVIAGVMGLAVVLYWPAIFVGFLSDDFVLIAHAARWEVGARTAAFSDGRRVAD